MSTWSEGWELIPAGSYQASYTAQVIQNILYEFRVRMSNSHVWDATTSPKCFHNPGNGFVDIVAGTVYSQGRAGGLTYNSTGKQLWRDNGATLDGPVGGLDHGVFTLNVTATTAHDQYGLVAGAQTYANLNLALNKVKGLPITDSGFSETYLISRKVHKGYSATTHAKHADDVITESILYAGGTKIGSTKIPISEESTLYSGTLGPGDYTGNLAMPDMSFMPYMTAISANGRYFRMLPGFYASSASFPASTAVVVNFCNTDSGGSITATIKVRGIT